jgi:hypothetical protein
MEEISFSEFEAKYMQPQKRWDFSKFKIVCVKCGSSKVEYNNTIEVGSGYYSGDIDRVGSLVVKCHDMTD